jgi:hypothetical protein
MCWWRKALILHITRNAIYGGRSQNTAKRHELELVELVSIEDRSCFAKWYFVEERRGSATVFAASRVRLWFQPTVDYLAGMGNTIETRTTDQSRDGLYS